MPTATTKPRTTRKPAPKKPAVAKKPAPKKPDITGYPILTCGSEARQVGELIDALNKDGAGLPIGYVVTSEVLTAAQLYRVRHKIPAEEGEILSYAPEAYIGPHFWTAILAG